MNPHENSTRGRVITRDSLSYPQPLPPERLRSQPRPNGATSTHSPQPVKRVLENKHNTSDTQCRHSRHYPPHTLSPTAVVTLELSPPPEALRVCTISELPQQASAMCNVASSPENSSELICRWIRGGVSLGLLTCLVIVFWVQCALCDFARGGDTGVGHALLLRGV